MKSLEFTEFLVKELVTKPDLVSVKEFDEDEFKVLQVLVSSDDISKVIGKDGNTINAIRTLVQSSAYLNNDKKVKINVDSF
ncbi:MAG: KH domain-containing protein [Bacilli bacterium]|nr:KH domain-containing protein [Bacilli bacterium]